MATKKGNRILTSLYLDEPVAEELKKLSKDTGVPQAVYLREAVQFMLAHYHRFNALIAGEDAPEPPPPPMLERTIMAAEKLQKGPKRSAARHK